MRLRREVIVGIGAVLLLQLTLGAFAISLLMRMSPAIREILAENEYSVEAVEEMLAILAQDPTTTRESEAWDRFGRALDRARANVTEEGEAELLGRAMGDAPLAFDGDDAARARLVASLREIGAVNRRSMEEADARAQRLGQSGAWAVAILATLSLAIGTLAYRRLRLQIEFPVTEVLRTLEDVRSGNPLARSHIGSAPVEIRQIAETLNQVLDQAGRRLSLPPNPDAGGSPDALRAALLAALDASAAPMVVLDARGELIAASRAAFDLDLPHGVSALREPPPGWTVEPTDGGMVYLLRGAPVEAPPAPTT